MGRKLAVRLGWTFIDSDVELENATGMSIANYFEKYGEPSFRQGEKQLIARLVLGKNQILSTGGGAFMDPSTRELIAQHGYSVWLKADLDTLVDRTKHRGERPLLKGGNVRQRLTDLLAEREPVYATADVTVVSDHRPPEDMAERVLMAVQQLTERQS